MKIFAKLPSLCFGSKYIDNVLGGVEQSFKLNVRHALHHNDRPYSIVIFMFMSFTMRGYNVWVLCVGK